MAFEIMIDQFEGPLDLMLHLIKNNKLDLFDLDMNILTDQYLQYLKTMEAMHLEIASEFLSELAGLIEYKSKRLLPREKVVIEEEYEEDQREKLVKRLLEYQRFKEISEVFKEKYEERQRLISKPMSEETSKWIKQIEVEDFKGSPYDLWKAMHKVLRRVSLMHPYETKVTIKELSVDERIIQIKKYIQNKTQKMRFDELCEDCVDLHMIIVTFLSILDLIKQKEIIFFIDEKDNIWIMQGENSYA